MLITKKELISKVTEALGNTYTQVEVRDVIQTWMESIIAEVGQGNDVVFRDFGSFKCSTVKAKVGRNPKKPEQTVAIPERSVVKFRVGAGLRKAVAGK